MKRHSKGPPRANSAGRISESEAFRFALSPLHWLTSLAGSLSCINDPKEDIAIEALGILRNLTCTVNNDPVSGLAEIGEERMLSLLEIGLTSKSNRIVNEVRLFLSPVTGFAVSFTHPISHFPTSQPQSIFTLVNLSTADEVTKLAIVKRNNLLRCLLALFVRFPSLPSLSSFLLH